jgi:hypothetical protein
MEKVGLRAKGVFRMDAAKRSRHTNAYLTGIGKSKRIVLFDTLLESHSKDRLPTLSVFPSRELGHGNILAMDIRGEKKGMLFALDEDGFPIRQKVTSPSELQFLGYLLKAFTVSPQLINPPKGCQRGDFQLSPHSPIRRFLSETEPCCLVMHGFSKLKSFVKGFLTP